LQLGASGRISLIADAFQPLLVRDLFAISRTIRISSIPDSILAPRAAFDLDFDDSHKMVSFDFRTPEFIVPAIASDCCRFSGAAFQTVSAIATISFEKHAVPWELIKLYYAAFYSGHAIIRLLGESCSFFDRRHVVRIDDLSRTMGKAPNFPIDAGLYRCTVHGGGTKLQCVKEQGGTHELFWRVFGERIDSAANDILSGPLVQVDAQSVFAQLESFRRLVRRHGSSWLSTLRNDCQYRHHYGVWFPSSIRKRERDMMGRLVSQWKADPMNVNLESGRFGIIGEFIVACTFIIAICRSLVWRIVERSTKGRSFFHYGPMAFIQ
jgi:hypothetical protein